ncbi:unnamed protein product [Cladocopium goreaui]|uniref:Uncharacterized protein n=1 Tax=Cladocopium goreaui TaxID=2562237 RepID=A0A9P1FKX3_9DINO|nr:unnamed protein product [Cladocopium goreaui]
MELFQGMSRDELTKKLQETRVLLAAAKQHRQSNFQPVPVKTEPGKSATRAEGLLPAEKPNTLMISAPMGGSASQPAETIPADTQEILLAMASTPKTASHAESSPAPEPSSTPSSCRPPSSSPPSSAKAAAALPAATTESVEGGNQMAEGDKDLLIRALAKIEELEGRLETASNTSARGKDDEKNEEEKDDDPIVTPDGQKVLGADALRMRLRRLTETKTSGKRWVDDKTQQDYKAGGERRQWLEIALLESLKKHGTGREANGKVRAEFLTRVVVVRERMQSKEHEVTGKWQTEEKLKSSGEYTPQSIRAIVSYCRRFPAALVRKWKYDENTDEFFVEDETTVKCRRSDLTRHTESTEMDDKVSPTAPSLPKGPDDVSGDESPESKPTPEQLGQKVVPDLEKFMDTLNTKMSNIYEMITVLEDKENPPPMERYALMASDLRRIVGKLEENFKIVAKYLTEIKMDDLDKNPADPKLREFLFCHIGEAALFQTITPIFQKKRW